CQLYEIVGCVRTPFGLPAELMAHDVAFICGRRRIFFRRQRIIAHKTRIVKKIFAAVFAFFAFRGGKQYELGNA
ncbi:MAG: hypothetical protein J6U75_05535, partial [Clostridia bacterium]|nr:hypothetical protein [Clostridia bacterium]